MDGAQRKENPSPLNKVNFFSRNLLIWFWPIFRLGYRQALKREDLWDPPEEAKAHGITETLEANWLNQLENESATWSKTNGSGSENVKLLHGITAFQPLPGYKMLLRALWSTFGTEYILAWPLVIINDCILRVLQPWFMLLLIRTFIETPGPNTELYQYLLAGGVVIFTLLLTFFNNPCQFYLGKLGQKTRISLVSLIQRKVMKVSASSSAASTTDQGQVTNLVCNDAAYIENNIANIPYLLVAPLQLAIFMVFLFIEFGWSSFAGLAFIAVYMPFQYWNGTLSSKYRGNIGAKTDERSRVLTELIEAIHSVKMYAWEKIFSKIVGERRKEEVKELKKRSMLHAFQMSIFLTSSRVVPFLTFTTFLLVGGALTADRVFYAVAVFNTVTHFMVFNLPAGIRAMGEIKGSLQRIQTFLLSDESPRNFESYKRREDPHGMKSPFVNFSGVTASWSSQGSSEAAPVLSNINLANLIGDKLVMIVGKVGSGKSSLLHSVLNELQITTGSLTVSGNVAYAPQESFLFPGTIRKNILFHNETDDTRYDKVVEVSGLVSDIEAFPRKHLTNVASLSGGQKARVNLARALYQSADIYLLDDPLSAVDAGVARHIVDNALKGYLRGKLRILVTHQLQYLNEADYVIVLSEGKIAKQGAPSEVEEEVKKLLGQVTETTDVDTIYNKKGSLNAQHNGKAHHDEEEKMEEKETEDDDTDTEKKAEGDVGLRIYWEYWKSGKNTFQLGSYLTIFLVAQVFTTLIEYWLALWTNVEEKMYEDSLQENSTVSNGTRLGVDDFSSFEHFIENLDNFEQRMYLYIYLLLTTIVFLTNLAKAVAFFYFSMRISVNIHEKMMSSLVRAKPEFFDKNTAGRIMNRFTKDIAVIDEQMPFQFFDMFTIFLQVGTVIALIIFAIWYSVIPVLVFLLALNYVRGYYVKTSRDLKRIDGTTRSPVITHLQAGYNGIVTIRAMGAVKALSEEFDLLQDDNTSATISFLAAGQCFNIWIETLATFLLAIVAFGFLLAQNFFGMEFLGGNVGLAICSAMSLTIWLQYGMKTSANVENLMISVERALEYTKLPPEANWDPPPKSTLPAGWPSLGKIKFENVVLSYDGFTDILKLLTFDVGPKQKIGVVGKTGAGKSSILRALFRMTELKHGQIFIDDVDISKLSLSELRRNIAIIPQTPQLFKGSLEFNLDPGRGLTGSGAGCDGCRNRMRVILETLGMKHSLDFKVETKGANLSIGERQLVSLARALITHRKIVCMDEATAHIDSGTDRKIQEILLKELGCCTVITIAHRLGTVIESDRMLVLAKGGTLAEYDHAHKLLEDNSGHLTKMLGNAGNDAETLRRRAVQSWQSKHEQRSSTST